MLIKKIILFMLCISLPLTTYQCKSAQYNINQALTIRILKIHITILYFALCCCIYKLTRLFFPQFSLSKLYKTSIENLYNIAFSFYKGLTHTEIIATRDNITANKIFSSKIDHLIIEKQANISIIINPFIDNCYIQINAASNITNLINIKEKNNSLTVNYGNYIITGKDIPYYNIYIKQLNSLTLSDTTCIEIIGSSVTSLCQLQKIQPPETKESILNKCSQLFNTSLLNIEIKNSIIKNTEKIHFDRDVQFNASGKSQCYLLSSAKTISLNAHDNSDFSIYGDCPVKGNLYDHSTLDLNRYERDNKKVQIIQHGQFTTLNKGGWE